MPSLLTLKTGITYAVLNDILILTSGMSMKAVSVIIRIRY